MPRLDRIGYETAAIGDRFGIDRLRYNPTIFRMYDRLARNDAPAVIQAVRRVFPKSTTAADVGAGTGAYASEAIKQGLHTVALERSPKGRRVGATAGVEMQPLDLHSVPPRTDLAYSFEVAEHIPASLTDTFVKFLTGCAPTVLLTAAPPGQGGIGHINEQPAEYWVEAFRRAGYRTDETKQNAFVSLLPRSLSSHWHTTSILVFVSQ